MIKRIFLTSVLATAALTALADQTAPAAAARQKFTIDQNHTQVEFSYDHLGFSHPATRLEQVKGTLDIDSADLTKSSVDVTLPLDGIHSGVPKLDEELKGADWFEAAKFPNITFKSTKVEKSGTDQLTVTGDVTAHVVTKPATLTVKVNKIGENQMMKTQTAGFDAETTLKRSDFGLGKYVPLVGDDLRVHITVSADLAK